MAFVIFFVSSNVRLFLKLTAHQGDQIGRIFARWAILYFGQLFETCLICPNFCATIFHGKSNALFSANNQLGHNLGDFFTNSSGHPAVQCQYLRSRNNNDPLLKKRPAHWRNDAHVFACRIIPICRCSNSMGMHVLSRYLSSVLRCYHIGQRWHQKLVSAIFYTEKCNKGQI
jgi:hypothetical protein